MNLSVIRVCDVRGVTEYTIYVEGEGYAYVVESSEEKALAAVRAYVDAGGKLDVG